jgi:AraC family transcriptional regulator of arabinose operon
MNIRSIACRSIHDGSYVMRHEPSPGEYTFLMTRSPALLGTNSGMTETGPGTVILWDDTVTARCAASGRPVVFDWICFDCGTDGESVLPPELPLNTPLLSADVSFIGELVRNIASEHYSLNSQRGKMTDTLMRILLMKLGENLVRSANAPQTVDPHYSALLDLRAKIYRNPQQKWNVDAMAADVNMSRSYFQHIYRDFFGVSCISDVITGKIEKAKEILSETSCTVSQVAAMCGYENEEHFMRQFKKIVGVTPTNFRRKI